MRAIDYTYLVEPNLLIPGKKPVGNVKIDTSHTLSKHLKFSADFNSIQPIDLVSGKALTSSGSPSLGANEKGQYIEASKSNPDYWTFAGLAQWSGENSVLEILVRIDSHDTNGSMTLSWADNGTYYWQIGTSSKCFVANSDVEFSTTDPDDGIWHHYFMGGFTDVSTYLRVYVDGLEDTSIKTKTKVDIPSGAKTAYFAKYVGGTAWDLDGGISLIRLWEDISTKDVIELTYDPYQFLIPA